MIATVLTKFKYLSQQLFIQRSCSLNRTKSNWRTKMVAKFEEKLNNDDTAYMQIALCPKWSFQITSNIYFNREWKTETSNKKLIMVTLECFIEKNKIELPTNKSSIKIKFSCLQTEIGKLTRIFHCLLEKNGSWIVYSGGDTSKLSSKLIIECSWTRKYIFSINYLFSSLQKYFS